MRPRHLPVATLVVFFLALIGAQDAYYRSELDAARHRASLAEARLLSERPVELTCVCQDYEDGWEDAEYVSGCENEELDLEEIEAMCAEFEEFGYAPGC
jgi:hypothetical protein